MITTSVSLSSVEVTTHYNYTAFSSDLKWGRDFIPDFVEVDGAPGRHFELTMVYNYAGMETIKFKQAGGPFFLTVFNDHTC